MTHKLHGDGVQHVGGGLTSSFGAAPKLLIRGFGGGMYALLMYVQFILLDLGMLPQMFSEGSFFVQQHASTTSGSL